MANHQEKKWVAVMIIKLVSENRTVIIKNTVNKKYVKENEKKRKNKKLSLQQI